MKYGIIQFWFKSWTCLLLWGVYIGSARVYEFFASLFLCKAICLLRMHVHIIICITWVARVPLGAKVKIGENVDAIALSFKFCAIQYMIYNIFKFYHTVSLLCLIGSVWCNIWLQGISKLRILCRIWTDYWTWVRIATPVCYVSLLHFNWPDYYHLCVLISWNWPITRYELFSSFDQISWSKLLL